MNLILSLLTSVLAFIAPFQAFAQASACAADFNGDGVVNRQDQGILIDNFFRKDSSLPTDLNRDSYVDATDYRLFVSFYNQKCDSPGASVAGYGLSNPGNLGPQNISVPNRAVRIRPGENLQEKINQNSNGTIFYLEVGDHRVDSLRAKDNQQFIGANGARLNGSKVLRDFSREGNLYVASNQTQSTSSHGTCAPSRDPVCKNIHDLFINDQLLTAVSSKNQVSAGEWYFDYAANKVYFADNPSGKKVEISDANRAFTTSGANVVVKNLIIEKFASKAQEGAIHLDGQRNWTIANNLIRFNHGVGMRIPLTGVVENNIVTQNGQLGVGGQDSTNLIVRNNEISYNNYAGYETGWEAGGTKFVKTDGIKVTNNFVHHNFGKGLWSDIDNVNTLYQYNLVERNTQHGIYHEISYSATIDSNLSRYNGRDYDSWLWGAQIVIATSSNVTVTNNIAVIHEDYGNGITLVQQNRGSGSRGEWLTYNTKVTDNTIIYLGEQGLSGGSGDHKMDRFTNNVFDRNTYYVKNPSRTNWEWIGLRSWDDFKSKGHERSGSIKTEAPPQKYL